MSGDHVGKDWDAVAAAINSRLDELQMTQQELAARSGVSPATLRQLQRNYSSRRRSPRTLAAISEGLRWPAGRLAQILEGDAPGAQDADLRDEVSRLRAEVSELQGRVTAVEDRFK
ncbi:MAG: helix-turn-helix domain-containing protein [Sciscionella sp.]